MILRKLVGVPAMSRAREPIKGWPRIFPNETAMKIRAASILSGSLLDGSSCPPLTIDQARDVLRWAGETVDESRAKNPLSV